MESISVGHHYDAGNGQDSSNDLQREEDREKERRDISRVMDDMPLAQR